MMSLTELLGKAREMQARMAEMQENLAVIDVDGMAGNGLVRCTLTGKGVMKALHIDESLLKNSEREILEDLIITAQNDAKQKLDARLSDEMNKLTSSLGLPPGLNLPF